MDSKESGEPPACLVGPGGGVGTWALACLPLHPTTSLGEWGHLLPGSPSQPTCAVKDEAGQGCSIVVGAIFRLQCQTLFSHQKKHFPRERLEVPHGVRDPEQEPPPLPPVPLPGLPSLSPIPPSPPASGLSLHLSLKYCCSKAPQYRTFWGQACVIRASTS